jgi:hypothetical protein
VAKTPDFHQLAAFARENNVKILAKWWDLPPTVGRFLIE